jgi:F-type H+-transporting ATPase subunit b
VLIDWFTVFAQILNFLILVALLKRFLYDRIIRAMDERESMVRSRLEAAEKKEKESEEEAEKYRRRNEELENKHKEMLDEARKDAESQRKELTQKARHDVENLRTRWQEGLQRERNAFLQELKQVVGQQVYTISRRALKDLADSEVEERIVHVFTKEMADLKREEKDKMASAIKENDNKVTLRSGFDIASNQRQQITRALHEQLTEDADVHYETDPDIIIGIELRSGGEKMAWSLEGYLKNLEDQTRAALERETTDKEAKKEKPDRTGAKSDREAVEEEAAGEPRRGGQKDRAIQKGKEEEIGEEGEREKQGTPKGQGKKKRRKKKK